MTLRVGLRHIPRRFRVPLPVCTFRSGFELAFLTDGWTGYISGSGRAPYPHHGSWCGQFIADQPDDLYVWKTLSGVNPLYFIAQAMITDVSDAGYSAIAMLTLGRWTYEWCSIYAEYDPPTYGDTDLHLRATGFDWFGTAYPINLNMVMDLNTWYLLQIACFRDPSAGWYKAWVNRSFRGQVTGLNNPFTTYPDHCAGLMNYTSLAGSPNGVRIDCCCLAKDYIRIDPYE